MLPALLFAAWVVQPATRIVVTKPEHTLVLCRGTRELGSYTVSLGSSNGRKLSSGDRKTPEGLYTVDGKNSDSAYHRALHLSYPNTEDRKRAQAAGKDPGGDIEIHGRKNHLGWLSLFSKHVDWTAGCIALTNDEIDAIWEEVPIGTPVEIKP